MTVVFGLVCLLAGAGLGCQNLRYYMSYKYRHIRTEVVSKPLPRQQYIAGIFRTPQGWYLRIMALKTCERKTVEVAEETAHIKVTSPTWYYFLSLGLLQTVMSTPFWALGSISPAGRERNSHLAVGTLVFLVPGLAVTGLGVYYRLRAGVYKKNLGQRRRTRKTEQLPCGVGPAAKRRVSLGTRTGPRDLGPTDSKGRVSLPAESLRPLVRWEQGRVKKVYFEVFVESEAAHEVKVPKGFPVHPADLKEPNLRR